MSCVYVRFPLLAVCFSDIFEYSLLAEINYNSHKIAVRLNKANVSRLLRISLG